MPNTKCSCEANLNDRYGQTRIHEPFATTAGGDARAWRNAASAGSRRGALRHARARRDIFCQPPRRSERHDTDAPTAHPQPNAEGPAFHEKCAARGGTHPKATHRAKRSAFREIEI